MNNKRIMQVITEMSNYSGRLTTLGLNVPNKYAKLPAIELETLANKLEIWVNVLTEEFLDESN